MAGARAPGLSSASLTIAFLDWAVGFFFFFGINKHCHSTTSMRDF